MEYRIIYKNGTPYGIRNNGGYVLFFPKIHKWTDQEERYKEELESQRVLSEKILKALNK